MKTNRIITISRQYGSGGREIGEKLAQELKIPFYDKEILNLAAEQSGFAPSRFDEEEQEQTGSLLFSLMRVGAAVNSYDLPLNDQIYLIQSRVIRQAAEQGPCVILGRCADYLLENMPNCLRFFFKAPLDLRIKHAVACHGIPAETAEATVNKMDRKRAAYYNYYTGLRFGNAEHYHLCLDTLSIGIDASVELLKQYVLSLPD